MSEKVLFFDIDGTLLDTRIGVNEIPESVKQEMKRLHDLGHKLFISSGRPRAMLDDKLLNAGFDGFVLANGAYVEIDGKSIYEDRMDTELTIKTMEMLEKLNCAYMIETAKNVYLEKENELYDFFYKEGFAQRFKTDFDKYDVITRALKIETNVTDQDRERVVDYIQNHFGYIVNFDEHGSQNAFELYSPTISKAVGIQKVLEYYKLNRDDSYAFGDGLNDLEMIQYCHVGVAMGNAVDKLKEAADLICQSTAQDGLAKILRILF